MSQPVPQEINKIEAHISPTPASFSPNIPINTTRNDERARDRIAVRNALGNSIDHHEKKHQRDREQHKPNRLSEQVRSNKGRCRRPENNPAQQQPLVHLLPIFRRWRYHFFAPTLYGLKPIIERSTIAAPKIVPSATNEADLAKGSLGPSQPIERSHGVIITNHRHNNRWNRDACTDDHSGPYVRRRESAPHPTSLPSFAAVARKFC